MEWKGSNRGRIGLDVQTIAPGHGRLGTIQDLQKALDTPAPN